MWCGWQARDEEILAELRVSDEVADFKTSWSTSVAETDAPKTPARQPRDKTFAEADEEVDRVMMELGRATTAAMPSVPTKQASANRARQAASEELASLRAMAAVALEQPTARGKRGVAAGAGIGERQEQVDALRRRREEVAAECDGQVC